jgi:periplasmic protein TonB
MKSINTVVALLFFTALTANAAPLLNGLALEQEFNKDRYIAGVYSERLSDNAGSLLDNNMPRRLEVRVVADRLSARRFRNQWMEGIAINNPGDTLANQAQNMVTFANLFKGHLIAGDQLRLDYAADTGTTSVSLNEIMLGMIEDRDFFNTLLRAWIGSVPPSTDFRDNLLAAGKVSPGLLASYESLKPSGDRVAQIAKMTDPQEAAEEQPAASESAPAEPVKVAAASKPAASTEDTSTSGISKPKPDLKADIPAPTLAALGSTSVAAISAAAKPPAAQTQAAKPKPLKPTTTRPAEPLDALEDEEEEEAPLTADMILARQIYHSMLLRHTFKHIRYPKRAQERGQEGSVRLNVTIDTKGNVKNVSALQESRFSSLNREAIEAVERAAPYPATPSQLSIKEYKFSVPITFRLPD